MATYNLNNWEFTNYVGLMAGSCIICKTIADLACDGEFELEGALEGHLKQRIQEVGPDPNKERFMKIVKQGYKDQGLELKTQAQLDQEKKHKIEI